MHFRMGVNALERRFHAFEKGVHILKNTIIFLSLGCSF